MLSSVEDNVGPRVNEQADKLQDKLGLYECSCMVEVG